jgi:hypothetical protein
MTDRPFSKTWLIASIVLFTCTELLLGGFIAHAVSGRHVSHMLTLRFEMLASLLSYFSGGYLVGLISPGPRLLEPAVAAAVSVVFTFLISFFTPLTFFHADPSKMLVGGVLAFGVALWGAHLGERVTGN